MKYQFDKLFSKESGHINFDLDEIKILSSDGKYSTIEISIHLNFFKKLLEYIGDLDTSLMSRKALFALKNITRSAKEISNYLVEFLGHLGEYIDKLNDYSGERKSLDYFIATAEVIEAMYSGVELLNFLQSIFRNEKVKLIDDLTNSIEMYKEMIRNLKKHLYNLYEVKRGAEEKKIIVHYLDETGDIQVKTMDDPLEDIFIDFGMADRIRESLKKRYEDFGRYGLFG